MAKALTAKSVEAASPEPGSALRREIPDGGLPGLYLVLQGTGRKSWAVRYRHAGKPRKLTIGPYPAFGLQEARQEARKALQRVEQGIDPAEAKVSSRASAVAAERDDRDEVSVVLDLFIKRHASRNRRGADVAAMFAREVKPRWGSRKIQSITRREAVELLDAIVDRGSPISANRLRAHLATFFGWCRSRDIVAVSPLEGVRPPAPERTRDRVLTDAELALFWAATGDLGSPFGPLYRVLLLTGQRLREVADMTGAEVTGGVWTIPAARAKNGDEHSVPLSSAALAELAAVERVKGRRGFLFTTTGDSPVSGFSRAKARLDAAVLRRANADLPDGPDPAAVQPFTIHDLRRTCATGMAALGFPPHVVEAVLNHRSGTRRGVAGIYNRHSYANEKRAALEAWERHVLDIAGVGPAAPEKAKRQGGVIVQLDEHRA